MLPPNSGASHSLSSPSQEIKHVLSRSLIWCIITLAIIPIYGLIYYSETTMMFLYKLSGRTPRPFPPVAVNRDTCTCNCWDEGSSGIYKKSNGYKHVYWNVTPESAAYLTFYYFLFSLTQLIILYFLDLVRKRRVDWLVAAGLLMNVPVMQYGLGVISTYINDVDNRMIYNQLPFTIAEVVVTGIFFWMLDKRRSLIWAAWVVILIDGTTLTKSLLDQVLNEPIDNLYSLTRTCILVSPDIFHIYIMWKRLPETQKRDRKLWMYVVGGIVGLVLAQQLFVGGA